MLIKIMIKIKKQYKKNVKKKKNLKECKIYHIPKPFSSSSLQHFLFFSLNPMPQLHLKYELNEKEERNVSRC